MTDTLRVLESQVCDHIFSRFRGCRSHKYATTYAVLLAYTLLNKLRRLALNFLIFLLSTDYILSHSSICLGLPTSTNFSVLPSGGIVVEPYLSVLAADCPLS